MRRRRNETAEEIEREEADRPHAVFDVVAEDPKEYGVAQDVRPTAVEKHRRDRRQDVDRISVDDTGEARADRYVFAEARAMCELARHHPEVADAGRQRPRIETGALHYQPDREHGSKDEPSHDRRAERGI